MGEQTWNVTVITRHHVGQAIADSLASAAAGKPGNTGVFPQQLRILIHFIGINVQQNMLFDIGQALLFYMLCHRIQQRSRLRQGNVAAEYVIGFNPAGQFVRRCQQLLIHFFILSYCLQMIHNPLL